MVTFSTLKFNFSSPKQVIGCAYLLVTGFDKKINANIYIPCLLTLNP